MHLAAMILFGALVVTGSSQQSVGEMKFPEGTVQHVVTAEDTPWGPCPPNLPPGCEIAVLEGDPQSADLFTVAKSESRDIDLRIFLPESQWHLKERAGDAEHVVMDWALNGKGFDKFAPVLGLVPDEELDARRARDFASKRVDRMSHRPTVDDERHRCPHPRE